MSNTINQARKILEKEKPSEIAARLGVKSQSNIGQLRDGKRPLTEKMAARIVEAYGGKVTKQEKPVRGKGPAEVAEPAEKKGWHAPNKPPTMRPEQVQAKQDMAKLAEEAHALLSRMGMAGMARAAVAKVVEDEVSPAFRELLGESVTGVELKASSPRLPAFLVIPIYGGGGDEPIC